MPAVSNHPAVECAKSLSTDILFLQTEGGGPLLVSLISATFEILDDRITPTVPPVDLNLGGELWGEPGKSSYKYEPQCAFMKPATDVVLIGSAVAQKAGCSQQDVGLCVGSLRKVVRVIGDRYWLKTFGMAFMSPPEPFESIPLIYERAFGGWDRSNPDPKAHAFEPRNPVGTGFHDKK